MAWTDLIDLHSLEAKGKAVVRHEGRQILLIRSDAGVFACANRCPHQGYPLSEGVLTGGCVLTCNWHNWKFDLTSCKTLVGGDRLRQFPVRMEGGRVLVDLSPEDPAERRTRILASIRRALADEDQERLVREAARLLQMGADPAEAVATAVAWATERLEFGTTHALAGAPDWLALAARAGMKPEERLAAIGEILGHIADDAHGGGRFPFPPGERPWNEAAFVQAVEDENEAAAAALLRGALATGMDADGLFPMLAAAALRHYADFGHSMIYVAKTVELIRRLGAETAEPLLMLLVRSLIYGRREDLLPEFRDYAGRLANWGDPVRATPPLDPAALRKVSAKQSMAIVAGWGALHPPEAIFEVAVETAAWVLLHVDETTLERTDGKIADNVGWLDFTHALTFADAGREAAAVRPDLWPAVLLQLACFVGRNAAYLDEDVDVRPWAVPDRRAFFAAVRPRLFDHGHAFFIISVHYLKTAMAAMALASALPACAPTLFASVNRFVHGPVKRRHVLRTARQMRAFVSQE